METLFFFCFVFGALFTTISVIFGFAGTIFSHAPGTDSHFGHAEQPLGHLGHGHGDVPTASHDLGQAPSASHAHGASGDHGGAHTHEPAEHANASPVFAQLPFFSVSAILAFLTTFGATGYILMHFAGWPAIAATPVALVPGALADILIAFALGKIMAGETIMRPIDYELQGTMARVTVSIPANGVGEIVFSKGGTRRSEAARSLSARAIPYNTEVVIVEYERGIALVQPYDEFVTRHERNQPAVSDTSSEAGI